MEIAFADDRRADLAAGNGGQMASGEFVDVAAGARAAELDCFFETVLERHAHGEFAAFLDERISGADVADEDDHHRTVPDHERSAPADDHRVASPVRRSGEEDARFHPFERGAGVFEWRDVGIHSGPPAFTVIIS